MSSLVEQAWTKLDGEAALSARVAISDPATGTASALPVAATASAVVGVATLAAAELLAARREESPRPVTVDERHALVAFASERHVAIDGRGVGPGWDPLSRFWPTADGWIRLQCNYPHHRARAIAALGNPRSQAAIEVAIKEREGLELEQAIVAEGGAAAALRDEREWRAHQQGDAVAKTPLVKLRDVGTGVAPLPTGPVERAADGVRVLDLTRVIAGPTCTRFLAAHGAEVLRVDTPDLPELAGHHLDGNWGKRSTLLDLSDEADARTFQGLLAEADLLVQGYRPGALQKLGLDAATLAEQHPGLVVISHSAWGSDGPWGERRGFDSLVQAASGIAEIEASARGEREPGVLPVQALDHATGYLAAAAALRGLARRQRDGVTWHAELALAATADWLLSQPRAAVSGERRETDPAPFLASESSVHRRISGVRPPGRIEGERAPTWRAPGLYGADLPEWKGSRQ